MTIAIFVVGISLTLVGLVMLARNFLHPPKEFRPVS